MSKVVVITGAGHGLGKAFAIGLSRAGYIVVATGRSRSGLNKLAERLQGDFLLLKCDVTHPNECHAVFNKVIEEFGRVDVLINNAGIYTESSFAVASPVEVKQVFDVVVAGTATMSSLALEKMKLAKSGQIINILDVSVKDEAGDRSKDGSHAIDSAAKYAKRAISMITANEAETYGVIVTDFYLRWVASDVDIDDSTAVPKGVTHPADAVKGMVRAVKDAVHEVVVPASK